MGIMSIAALATPNAVADSVSTRFTTTGAFWFLADGLDSDDRIVLLRLGPSGEYKPMTGELGPIVLSENPNTAYIPGGGSFSATKVAGATTPAVGYEEI